MDLHFFRKCKFLVVNGQGRIQGSNLGLKTPPSMEIFFNLLGFLRRKSQNTPLSFFKFFLKHPSRKYSGYAPVNGAQEKMSKTQMLHIPHTGYATVQRRIQGTGFGGQNILFGIFFQLARVF